MKIIGYLSFALCLLLSSFTSYASSARQQAAKSLILEKVKTGQMTRAVAEAQATRFGVDLTAEFEAYFFPPHWQQFFQHFNGLAYDQLVAQLEDVAQDRHVGALMAPSLKDVNIPVRDSAKTSLSQWLISVRGALFNNNGKLHHNQDRKPQFEKFISAAQVNEAIGHTENPAFCKDVFEKVVNSNKSIEAAYVERLGNVPCPHIDNLNIADDVAKRVINDHIKRDDATQAAKIHAHAQNLAQRNLGWENQKYQDVAREIVENNLTPAQALTAKLGNIDCDDQNIAPQVAALVMNQNHPLDAATRQASINKREEFLKNLNITHNLGLEDDLCHLVAETVTATVGANKATTADYVTALAPSLDYITVESTRLGTTIAHKVLNDKKTLLVATREASIARRVAFLKEFSPDLPDAVCESVATEVTGGGTYLTALQTHMDAGNYEGENLTPQIAKILWTEIVGGKKITLEEATQQAKINKLTLVWKGKNLGLSQDECNSIAQAIVVHKKTPETALTEYLSTANEYAYSFKHTPEGAKTAAERILKQENVDTVWHELCIKPRIAKLEKDYQNLDKEFLKPIAIEHARHNLEPNVALAQHLEKQYPNINYDIGLNIQESNSQALAKLMIDQKLSFVDSRKELFTRQRIALLKSYGFDFLDDATLTNICNTAYNKIVSNPYVVSDTNASIIEDGLSPYLMSMGIDDPADFMPFLRAQREKILDQGGTIIKNAKLIDQTQLVALKEPYLIDKKTRELQAEHSNIPAEALHYIAEELVSTKNPLNSKLLAEALRSQCSEHLKMEGLEKDFDANNVAELLLTPQKPDLSQAKIALVADRLSPTFTHLPSEERHQLASIMITQVDKFDPAEALTHYCNEKGFDAKDVETIIDLVTKQNKTLAYIDNEFGFKKYQRLYPVLTEEQAHSMAKLAVKLVAKRASPSPEELLIVAKNYQEQYHLTEEVALFQAKLAAESVAKRGVSDEELLKEFIRDQTGEKEQFVLGLAADYFEEDKAKRITLDDAVAKARFVNEQMKILDSKKAMWGGINISDEDMPGFMIAMAEDAFNNQHDLSISVANFLQKSEWFPLTLDLIKDDQNLQTAAYRTIAQKMLGGTLTFKKVCEDFWDASAQIAENAQICIAYLLKPDSAPEELVAYDSIISKILPNNNEKAKEALDSVITLSYFIHGLDGQFFQDQLTYATSNDVAQKNQFKHAELKAALVDALTTYYKKTNTYEVAESITEPVKELEKNYPYLSHTDVVEIAYNDLLLEKDVRKTVIARFIETQDLKDLGLNNEQKEDIEEFIPKLAAFMTDKSGLDFQQAQQAFFKDFLESKHEVLGTYGFTPKECDEIAWKHLILDEDFKMAMAKVFAQRDDAKFPPEILGALNEQAKKSAKLNFAVAVAERLLNSSNDHPLTLAEAIEAQRISTQKSSLRRQGIKLSDSDLMTVARTIIQKGKDSVGALIDLFKSHETNFDVTMLSELGVKSLIGHMQKGAFFTDALYSALFENIEQQVDLGEVFTEAQKKMHRKLLSAELMPMFTFEIDKPVSLLNAMDTHWSPAKNLLTQLNNDAEPSEFELTLTLYHYLEVFKDNSNGKVEAPEVAMLNSEMLEPAWLKAKKWTYAHSIQMLNLDSKLIDIDSFGKKEIEDFAVQLADKGIFTPEELLNTPLEDIIKTYRRLFNLTPNTVIKDQTELFLRIIGGREAAKQAEESEKVKRSSDTAVLTAIENFAKSQKESNEPNYPRISIENLRYDPHLKVPPIENFPEVSDQEYKNAHTAIQKVILQLQQNKFLTLKDESTGATVDKLVHRFWSWGDLKEVHDQNLDIVGPFSGTKQGNYRKRVMRFYQQRLEPLIKNIETNQDDIKKSQGEFAGILGAILGAKGCDNASLQVLSSLEGDLPSEDKPTIFSRIAYILRAWRIEELRLAGVSIEEEKQRGSLFEPETILALNIINTHSLSIHTNPRKADHMIISDEDLGTTTTKLLENYRHNIIEIVRSSISCGNIADHENSLHTIYFSEIAEWAKKHSKYCNESNLLSALTDKVTKTVKKDNGTEVIQEEFVVKEKVIWRLLHSAGYIEKDIDDK